MSQFGDYQLDKLTCRTNSIMQVVLLLFIFSLTSQFSFADKEPDSFTEATRFGDGVDPTWGEDRFTPTNSATEREAKLFLRKLFTKYGTDGMMTFEGFEHLLQSLGIGKVKIEDHDIHDHYTENGFVEFHPSHNHTDLLEDEVDNHHHGNNSHHHGDDEKQHSDRSSHHGNEEKHHHGNEGHSNHDEDDHSSNVAHSNQDIQDYQDKEGDSHETDINDSELTYTESLKRLNRTDSYDPTLSSNVDYSNSEEPNENLRRKGKKGRGRKNKRNRNRKEPGNSNTDTSDGRIKRAASQPKHGSSTKQCMTAKEILHAYHLHLEGGISENHFLNLCPAIIYQIDQHACHHGDTHDHDEDSIHTEVFFHGSHSSKDSHCQDFHSNHGHHVDMHHVHGNFSRKPVEMHSFLNVKPVVWGYASAAVSVISLVGLLSVAIVPIMRKVFFNYLIQYLVALAIGSLTGDALLHLIPHALGGGHGSESAGHESHDLSLEGATHEDSHSHDKSGVYKGLVVLAGIYFFFLMERLMQFCTEQRHKRRKKRTSRELFKAKFENIGEKLSHYKMDDTSENIMMMYQTSKLQDSHKLVEVSMDVSKDDLLEEQDESQGHGGHGHGHGHSHGDGKIPQTISAIAWMVIMGDGLHNFSDGLAIGAAFADSVTGGLSTSVAVFCHELPHELGDFAVLLRAGMSVKQALFYNIVSSVLCYLGMVIGVAIGNLSAASLWIFALAAGMFIYISLVDMLPEITAPPVSNRDNRCCMAILQVLGITTGVGIMLLIALYEDKIKLSVGDENGS